MSDTVTEIPELISHPLCPFTQRCVLAVLKQGMQRDKDFQVRYVDLGALPDWFTQLFSANSGPAFPTLRIDDDIFTDAEAIFDRLAGSLLPADADEQEIAHVWITKSATLLNLLRDVYMGQDKAQIDDALSALFQFAGKLERDIDAAPGLANGEAFSIVDVAFAPFFSLVFHYDSLRDDARWKTVPRMRQWGQTLIADKDVSASRCPDYAGEFDRFFEVTGGAFARIYGEAPIPA